MAQARLERDDYPVGIPLRPPPGWKGGGVTAPPPLPPRLVAPKPPAQHLALKAGLIAAMVFVCASVGWLAVADPRGPKAKHPRSNVAPEPVAKQTPREEPKADPKAKPVVPAPMPPPAPTPPVAVLTYERHILPIVERSCVACHGRGKKRGDLDLSTYAALLKGGENGTVVSPGKPADSPILGTILAGKMPPGGKKLPPADVRLIREWIATGARGGR